MNKTTLISNIKRPGHAGPDYRLFVQEHDGRLWATNSYWLAPADWFRLVLPDDYGIGTYNVKVGEKLSDDAPSIERLMPPAEGWGEIKPSQHNGRDIIVPSGPDVDVRLFTLEDDSGEMALDRRYVDLFTTLCGQVPTFTGTTSLKPVGIYTSSRITRIDLSAYDALTFTGLLMPVRLS